MFRKDLIPMLQENSMTVLEIARVVEESPKDVEDDLQHLFRSLKHGELEPCVEPATCRKCGFEFGSEKLRKPSKCPECKATWLTEPRISIRSKS